MADVEPVEQPEFRRLIERQGHNRGNDAEAQRRPHGALTKRVVVAARAARTAAAKHIVVPAKASPAAAAQQAVVPAKAGAHTPRRKLFEGLTVIFLLSS